MEAGKLNRRITIETNTTTDNAYGEHIDTWGDAVQTWAEVRFPTAREIFQADQLTAVQTAIFKIRYRPGIYAAKVRVIHDGQTYNITGVTEIGMREGLQLIGEAENNG
jgi:SPP1 family predicted phage head-tail adaptor